jgi:hypothetical protein
MQQTQIRTNNQHIPVSQPNQQKQGGTLFADLNIQSVMTRNELNNLIIYLVQIQRRMVVNDINNIAFRS